MTSEPLSQKILTLGKSIGFHIVGITSARPSEHLPFYEAWIREGADFTNADLSKLDVEDVRFSPEHIYTRADYAAHPELSKATNAELISKYDYAPDEIKIRLFGAIVSRNSRLFEGWTNHDFIDAGVGTIVD